MIANKLIPYLLLLVFSFVIFCPIFFYFFKKRGKNREDSKKFKAGDKLIFIKKKVNPIIIYLEELFLQEEYIHKTTNIEYGRLLYISSLELGNAILIDENGNFIAIANLTYLWNNFRKIEDFRNEKIENILKDGRFKNWR